MPGTGSHSGPQASTISTPAAVLTPLEGAPSPSPPESILQDARYALQHNLGWVGTTLRLTLLLDFTLF